MGNRPSKEDGSDLDSIITKENAIDMEKATIMIWKNRENPSIIEQLATLLEEYHDQKVTFEGFEFYLPQLAHMLIHLEVDWQSTALTQLILTACQQSLHLALQLHFILVAAMEDYALELSDGRINPYGNPVYYRRCAKLLQNVHRCVVYLPGNLKDMERLLENGAISKQEYQDKSRESKKIQAKEMIDQNIANDEKQDGSISLNSIKSLSSSNSLSIEENPDSNDNQESGYKNVKNISPSNLLDNRDTSKNISEGESLPVYEGSLRYKRAVRKRFCSLKRWQNKWFRIQHRVLYCYSQRDGRMIRAIPLESCTVKEIEYKDGKYENVFEVKSVNCGVETIFQMIAESKIEMDRWIRHIEAQSIAPTFGEEKLLYRAEYARYKFFRDQRDFINKLTDIAEDMRFLERSERTRALRKRYHDLEIPKFTYSPLCKSTDPLNQIIRLLPEEGRAFNTKARCPCLTIFEVTTEEVDVATYLHMKYESVIDKARLSIDGSLSDQGEKDREGSIGNLSVEDIQLGEKSDEKSGGILSWINWGGSQQLVEPNAKDIPELKNERTSIVTYAINQKEGNQHIQDAPLLLGPDVDDNIPSSASRGGNRRGSRFSLDLSSSASKYQEYIRPSVWRDEISKLLHKKNDGDKDGIEMIDNTSKLTKQKSVSKVDRHVPAYGEIWIKKKERLLEQSKKDFGNAKFLTSNRIEGEIDVSKTEERIKDEISSNNRVIDENKWDLDGFIVKSNDDLRQEVFVMQMIEYFGDLFSKADLPLYVRPYKIMSTGNTTGLIQFVKNAISITALKENEDYQKAGTLKQHFINTYGKENEEGFKTAQHNYIKSLAAYSIICYVMALKDRHNGNIMIDIEGHVVHIDFGFVFGIAPGGAFSFERAPFKLTIEMVDLLGGPGSETWEKWIDCMTDAFECIRENIDVCIAMFEIVSFQSKFPCFKNGTSKPLAAYKNRLLYGKTLSREGLRKHICSLVRKSYNHCGTRFYDNFQLWTNKIIP